MIPTKLTTIQTHILSKMLKQIITPIIITAAIMSSCQTRPEQADLVLLYTTDVHGACLHYDIRHDRPARTSLANVFTYVKQQREATPGAVMLFDTGDYLQGQPSMYYYNFVDTSSPHIVASISNYIGYDAIGVGNHDIETGESVYYDRLPHEFQMPILCANAIDQRTGKPMFKPYMIVNRQGIRVAILGMITPNIAAWLPKQLWPNLEFQDMVECAQQWVPIIMQQEKPDLLVGLFHSGSDYTVNNSDIDTYKNENGGIPAAIKVPGFDIILCGHDHQVNISTIVNVAGDTVQVIDAQTQAARIGRADIHLTLDAATGRYQKQITTSLIEMKEVEPDPEFCDRFQFAVDTVNAYVDKTIGQLTATLYGEPSLYGPSEFMDFIHDVQLWATDADVSFAAVLSPHDSVPAGPLTMRQLFTLYKYENLLFKVRMTGAEIKRYLEFGFNRQFNEMKSAADHLLVFKYDDKGKIVSNNFGPQLITPTFNYTSAAGIRYTVDLSKPHGQQLTIHSMSDGTPFDLDKEYTVALNSYQASGGGDFIPVGLGWSKEECEARTLSAETKDVRRYVADYIQAKGVIEPRLRGDWQLIPTDWWQQGMATDKRFTHPNQR